MRSILFFTFFLSVLMLSGCQIHEWPSESERVSVCLRLNFDTGFTEWNHTCDKDNVEEQGYGETYDNSLKYGVIRYIVRVYPETAATKSDHVEEYNFTKNISEGYDHEITLELPVGDYGIRVWSDMVSSTDDDIFYNTDSFSDIRLNGEHRGVTDHRDAFKGMIDVSISPNIALTHPYIVDLAMTRPLAKYEFVSNDVTEFIKKEITRYETKYKLNEPVSDEDLSTRAINIEDYSVVFYYVGFMPNSYDIRTDKPVDSTTGVMFKSTMTKLSESTASIGFDYVFVNGKSSAVTLKIGIYDKEGTQLSMSSSIEVPLTRSYHTILTGSFLMSDASEGLVINPDFNGDYNLVFP